MRAGAFYRGRKNGEKVADPVHLRGETENLIPFSARIIKAANMLFPFPCRSPFSLPFSPSTLPTSCPNAIKLLAARRANGEMSLTMVVIAGACRVSRFKSSFYLLHDRPGLNPIFVFIRTRFPGDRAIPRIPLSLSLSSSLLRNSSKFVDSEGAVDEADNFFFIHASFLTNDQQRIRVFSRIRDKMDAQKRRIFRTLFLLKGEIGVYRSPRGGGNISESAIRSPG